MRVGLTPGKIKRTSFPRSRRNELTSSSLSDKSPAIPLNGTSAVASIGMKKKRKVSGGGFVIWTLGRWILIGFMVCYLLYLYSAYHNIVSSTGHGQHGGEGHGTNGNVGESDHDMIKKKQKLRTLLLEKEKQHGMKGSSLSTRAKGINSQQQIDTCAFRKYPPKRYYGLQLSYDEQPDFLKHPKVEYIFGKVPQLLSSAGQYQTKLCVNQQEWYNGDIMTQYLPFADGTNPSILKIKNNPKINWNHHDFSTSSSLLSLLPDDATYLATICMTNSQCSWKETLEEKKHYKISPTQTEPSTIRTVLLVLNNNFETLAETTIVTRMDGPFGRKNPKAKVLSSSTTTNDGDGKKEKTVTYQKQTFALDDARLFTYRGKIWVSYREGKNFGYDKQVLNPLHFYFSDTTTKKDTSDTANAKEGTKKLHVELFASETETLCCGRNMALIDTPYEDDNDNMPLQALTWVDPITVVNVDMKQTNQKDTPQIMRQRRLLQRQEEEDDDDVEENHHHHHHSHDLFEKYKKESIRLQTTKQQFHDEDTLRTTMTKPTDTEMASSHTSADTTTTTKTHRRRRRRRLGEEQNGGRTTTEKKKKSDFHGTNGSMVHVPFTNEYLGIGHFHRPPGREQNDYARFGHHYTHAFFTIPDRPPYYLKRISAELLLPSIFQPHDGEIIQFWSGLELIHANDANDNHIIYENSNNGNGGGGGGGGQRGQQQHNEEYDGNDAMLALAYGINDCEGAATYVEWSTINSLLQDVPEGKEVVDLLQPPLNTKNSNS